MTSWHTKSVVLVTLAAQILSGMQGGRALFLAHCDEGEHECVETHTDSGCDSDACLAILTHHHASHAGSDHKCRCPHVHVRNESQPAARFRFPDSLKKLHEVPAQKPPECGGAVVLAPEALRRAAGVLPDDGPPQALLAIRAVRILI